MKRFIQFLRGTVSVVITGVEPERILNFCARAGVLFWGVERQDGFTLTMKVTGRGFPVLIGLATQAQCTLEVSRRAGLPFFILRFRKRYALLAGFLLCLGIITIFSRFIWVIDVSGNDRVSTTEILSELRRKGVRPGVYGPSIAQRELSNEMLLSMEELSFFSLNLHGTRAEVLVREKEPKPELLQENVPTDVRARATGIITHMEVLTGEPLYREGDTVVEGEILVRGAVQVSKEGEPQEFLWTHAQARVTARTWHTISAEIPLRAQVKDYTGEENVRFSLNMLGKRIKFYGNGGISFPKYDKIIETKTWGLSEEKFVPVTLTKETIRQYEWREAEMDTAMAEALLRERLLSTLQAGMKEGTVLKTDYVTQMDAEFLTVTLLAECTEEIDQIVPAAEPESPDTLQTEERNE